MSYTALYRKWRPASFDEVRGQDSIVQTLKNQIISGRIGHAYLFCGTRGTGKTSVAKIFAKAVNCEQAKEGSPCQICPSCQAISQGASMNVVEIDAASNNGVENIRDIREQVQYPPTDGRYRVYIIDEVHMLSIGAFNALLKTLEEPPSYVIFILATTEVHKIPVTILSRCQRYDFKRISADTIGKRLLEVADAEKIAIEEKAVWYLAKAADGAFRDALSLLDQCIAFHFGEILTYDHVLDILGAVDQTIFSQMFRAVAQNKTKDCILLLEEIVIQGGELGQFVHDFIWYLRNLLLVQTAEDGERLIEMSEDNRRQLVEDAKQMDGNALIRDIRILSELSNQLRYASQKRILIEIALIKLTKPEMEVNIESLLERIANLEALFEKGLPVHYPAETQENEKSSLKEEKAVKEEKVILSSEQFNDLSFIRREWKTIVEQLGGSIRPSLRETTIEPDGDSGLCIVFYDSKKYDIGSRRTVLDEVERFIEEKYQKFIHLTARLKKGNEPDNTIYVSEEELNEKILIDHIEKEEE